MSTRWPTPLKKIRERHPNGPVVQMRITFSRGTDISYDGIATEELMAALFNIIVGNTPDPAMRKILEAMEDEALKELDDATERPTP
jgi:hypothetical protein